MKLGRMREEPLREKHRARDNPSQGRKGVIDSIPIGTNAHDLYKNMQSSGEIGWTGRKVLNL